MSETRNYSLGRVPQIFGGPDALNQLPALVQASGAQSVAVIADAAVEGNGFLERLKAVLPGIQTFIVAPGEPTCAETNRAADFARTLLNPLILGVGGGSALDIAKQVAAVICAPQGIEHYLLRCEQVSGSIWAEESCTAGAVDLPVAYSNEAWSASGHSLSFMLSRD